MRRFCSRDEVPHAILLSFFFSRLWDGLTLALWAEYLHWGHFLILELALLILVEACTSPAPEKGYKETRIGGVKSIQDF